jgi:Flp pilus assembly protein TadG
MRNANIVKSDRGQTIVIFALILPILILFAGLAIDVGLLYVTKAKLTTSVDAACLTGMKNLTLGQTTAGQLAIDMFQANFGPNPPVPTVTFPLDASNNQQVKVTATASVRTLFMQYLQQWASVPVSATAVSTRGKLLMSLALDRSGSMANNGGGVALQYAVPLFIANFSNTLDEVAMVSFSDNATVDFGINYNFWGSGSGTITTKVGAMSFAGGTFGTGAGSNPVLLTDPNGPPLSMAQKQNDSVTILPGQNVVKVVVYFTDGLMNTFQDKIHCGGIGNATLTLLNWGGFDSGSNVDVFDPTSATNIFQPNYTGSGGFKYGNGSTLCTDASGNVVNTFPSQKWGTQKSFDQTITVTPEAQYRAVQTAIAMRTEAPIPTYIYTIGMGTGVTTSTQNFLAQLANDPDPKYPVGTYIAGQPAGEFFYIPSCSGTYLPSCKTQLNTAFQTIAAKVLLRLTQ